MTEIITNPRSIHEMTYNTHRRLAPSALATSGPQETSIAAFDSLDPQKKSQREQKILAYIRENGGATCWEVETTLGLLHQSASATITRLRRIGHLVDTGERRPTNTGRMAIVWGAAQ